MFKDISRSYNRLFDAVTKRGVRSGVAILIFCAITVILVSYGDSGIAQISVRKYLILSNFQIFLEAETMSTFSKIFCISAPEEGWSQVWWSLLLSLPLWIGADLRGQRCCGCCRSVRASLGELPVRNEPPESSF